jgi:hypothetical protein
MTYVIQNFIAGTFWEIQVEENHLRANLVAGK